MYVCVCTGAGKNTDVPGRLSRKIFTKNFHEKIFANVHFATVCASPSHRTRTAVTALLPLT